MALTWFACANCGFWQKHFAPPDCPVCTDVRNDLPEDGWHFLPEAEVAATHDGGGREVAPGLWAFTTRPALGLAGTGWLIVRDGGNIAFEAAPYYSDAMLEQIAALGGIACLSASHAHGYGALFQLQRRFEPKIVAIQLYPHLQAHRSAGHPVLMPRAGQRGRPAPLFEALARD